MTSDHGFSTHDGTEDLAELFIEHGLKESVASQDVVVAGGAIYVLEGGPSRVADIVRLLQRTAWADAIFTREAGDDDGADDVRDGRILGGHAGTFSFSAIGWDHERAGDILVAADWTDAANEHGYPGTSYQTGVAGHGTASPWDIRATLIAAGPAFKRSMRSEVPTGHIDLAPTILHLHGLAPNPGMRGRVLHELLHGGPEPESLAVERRQHVSESDGRAGAYRAVLQKVTVAGVDYLDFARVDRRP